MLIFALVESDSFHEHLHTNPFNFVDKNLTQISVQVDCVSFPSKPYQVDFETGRSLEHFDGLLDVLGKKHAPGGSLPFDRDGYAKCHTFFAFDLSPSGCGRDALGLIKQGNVTISLQFAKPLEKTLMGVSLLYFDFLMEINTFRQLLTDFVA
ncbi:hypothetical protein RvY_19135 [Ramazzottius varieornatus]|uniref:Uncharacterized protein n=1 Tax=Ramazzottius varieornatus TaxID=947166 RepID=A0A1D1W8E0_RAMVA|nr:hypothetical protein RvY_19135 [Ramazzottius varieornatus]